MTWLTSAVIPVPFVAFLTFTFEATQLIPALRLDTTIIEIALALVNVCNTTVTSNFTHDFFCSSNFTFLTSFVHNSSPVHDIYIYIYIYIVHNKLLHNPWHLTWHLCCCVTCKMLLRSLYKNLEESYTKFSSNVDYNSNLQWTAPQVSMREGEAGECQLTVRQFQVIPCFSSTKYDFFQLRLRSSKTVWVGRDFAPNPSYKVGHFIRISGRRGKANIHHEGFEWLY